MANYEQVKLLKQGVAAWNAWREKFPEVWPDLRGINLSNTDLSSVNLSNSDLLLAQLNDANLSGADLSGANLSRSYLGNTNLTGALLSHAELASTDCVNANLSYVNLIDAFLSNTNLNCVNLSHSKLTGARLVGANLTSANLTNADLTNVTIGSTFYSDDMQPTSAHFIATTFAWVNLCSVEGLDTMIHSGPSIVDVNTVKLPRGKMRMHFLRGVGFSDAFIDYLPSLLTAAIQYESCFISYAHQDEVLAERLYKDLQDNGVRCWLASHDLRPGTPVLRGIEEAIQLHKKLLLILTKYAVESSWVEREVDAALYQEIEQHQDILFPIRLDNTVLESTAGWARRLRHRHIGDFTQWQEEDAYQEAFTTLLHHLKVDISDTLKHLP